MNLIELYLENFRGYSGKHRITLDRLTAFLGKNDAGKSTIFEALELVLGNSKKKVSYSDFSVSPSDSSEMRIGCVFDNPPEALVIDSKAATSLEKEYLLNSKGKLEVHFVYPVANGKLGTGKIILIANHPSVDGFSDLHTLKNAPLKSRANALGITSDDADLRSNVSLRAAIWAKMEQEEFQEIEIDAQKSEAKDIWTQIEKHLPFFALFRSDRSSTDEDDEVQDPLKLAVLDALKHVEKEMKIIKAHVEKETGDTAARTIKNLQDFDSELASKLTPNLKSDPKWESLFKLSLTGDDEIPINQRGSGVRRLVLFSFFRTKVERQILDSQSPGVIYAIEEPETAQHPRNQKAIMKVLERLSEVNNTQVLITTHVPTIAAALPLTSIRYVSNENLVSTTRRIPSSDDFLDVAKELGIAVDHNVKVIVSVEGPNDVRFLKNICRIIRRDPSYKELLDIEEDTRVAFIVAGGSSLKDAVTEHHLKNLNIPQVHIYDSDKGSASENKYLPQIEQINNRKDGSVGFLTSKREMENYLHVDAINETLEKLGVEPINFDVADETDIPSMISDAIGRTQIQRQSLKYWLNEQAVSNMTIDRLKARNGLEEILTWFRAIEQIAAGIGT